MKTYSNNMKLNLSLINRLRQLNRGKNTLSIIRQELESNNEYISEFQVYAYYLLTFKYWQKDYVIVDMIEYLKSTTLDPTDMFVNIIFYVIKAKHKHKND